MNLTIFYDGQYWVGVIERTTEAGLFASKHIFGSEPSDKEVLEFVLKDLGAIFDRQTIAVAVDQKHEKRLNPKRAAREAARRMKESPVSTKAQQAIQSQYEANKKEKRTCKHEHKHKEQAQRWEKRREKAKQRHRGK